jgi:riboflavin synthase
MFTGIVTDVGRVAAMAGDGKLKRITIESDYDSASIALGASIACGGPCLTVVSVERRGNGCAFDVDAAAETLARTTVADWDVGTRVNLERALKIGDELGGHIVTGHVDAVATIIRKEAITAGDDPWGPTARFHIEVPAELAGFIAEKGSVCLDGTSLTVNTVEGNVFTVLIIPHTLSVTTWGAREAGDKLNLEVDMMARYAARLADARAAR